MTCICMYKWFSLKKNIKKKKKIPHYEHKSLLNKTILGKIPKLANTSYLNVSLGSQHQCAPKPTSFFLFFFLSFFFFFLLRKKPMTLIDRRLKISSYKRCNVCWIGLQPNWNRKTMSGSLGKSMSYRITRPIDIRERGTHKGVYNT